MILGRAPGSCNYCSAAFSINCASAQPPPRALVRSARTMAGTMVWMTRTVRYATRLQAEKALAAGHGSRLTETVMLGVQRINEDEVRYYSSTTSTYYWYVLRVFGLYCCCITSVGTTAGYCVLLL